MVDCVFDGVIFGDQGNEPAATPPCGQNYAASRRWVYIEFVHIPECENGPINEEWKKMERSEHVTRANSRQFGY